MMMTRANVTCGRGETLPEAVAEAPARLGVEIELEVVLVVRHYPEVVAMEQYSERSC